MEDGSWAFDSSWVDSGTQRRHPGGGRCGGRWHRVLLWPCSAAGAEWSVEYPSLDFRVQVGTGRVTLGVISE